MGLGKDGQIAGALALGIPKEAIFELGRKRQGCQSILISRVKGLKMSRVFCTRASMQRLPV
jgi:hypothetical protein